MMPAVVLIVNIIAMLAAAAAALTPAANIERSFKEFARSHGRRYRDAAETGARLHAFTTSLADAARRNEDPNELAEFGVTKFSDFTTEEFISTFGSNISHSQVNTKNRNLKLQKFLNITSKTHPPKQFDWRDYNVVSGVRDQGKDCAASYAFAAMGSLESAYARSHIEPVELSPQEIISCCDLGCSMTNYDIRNIFTYLSIFGMETEKDYPYKGKVSSCELNEEKVISYILDYHVFEEGNGNVTDENLMVYMLLTGATVIALDATALKDYKGGILVECPSSNPNVVMLLVGYGVENNVPFWSIKTSFGTDFGEKGYVRIKRGIDACGIGKFMKMASTADVQDPFP